MSRLLVGAPRGIIIPTEAIASSPRSMRKAVRDEDRFRQVFTDSARQQRASLLAQCPKNQIVSKHTSCDAVEGTDGSSIE
jgi:hypothetical protein